MPPTAVHSPIAARSSSEYSASDRSLVTLAARGDQGAFEVLFQRHRPGVHAYAARMLADHSAAEDVVQDVFFSAMRSLRSGTEPRHVRAWLQEIARCACVDHWRGSERRREVSYDAPDSLSGKDERQMAISGDVAMRGAADRERLADLQSAFEDLPPLQHSVLVQRELEGRSSTEIAERLGITPTVVEGQLARGRRSLAVSYRELQSGERCTATLDLCEASLDRSLGVRDRARVRVHLRTCSSCRRHARAAGVESRLFDPRVLSHLGFLLPLPLLRRFPLSSLFASSESLGAAIAGKALVGAAVIAAGGGSALVVSDIGPGRGSSPAPVVQEAEEPVTFAVGDQAAQTVASTVVLVPASSPLNLGSGAGAPEVRLAFASSADVPSSASDESPRRAPKARREAGAAVASSSSAPAAVGGGVGPSQSVPLMLPRFVPSTPPRVQRLAPTTEAPATGGSGPNATVPTSPTVNGPGMVLNGKQLPPAPETKIGSDPVPADPEPTEPTPAPEPEPAPEVPAPVPDVPAPDPGNGEATPAEPPTPPAGGGESTSDVARTAIASDPAPADESSVPEQGSEASAADPGAPSPSDPS